MSDPIIQIKDMNKWFGDFQVLKDINLEVEKRVSRISHSKFVIVRQSFESLIITCPILALSQ